MAEEPYIKMRKKLRHDPRVVAMSARLQRSRPEVIGGLFLLWCLGDEHGEILRGLTKPLLDEVIGIPGFSDALPPEWLQERVTRKGGNVTAALHLPNYVGHNATTERTRALTRERVRKHREKKKAECNGVTALPPPTDQTRPDQKRREEKPPPQDAQALAAYARECCSLTVPSQEVVKLLKVYGHGWVVEALEHLASREPDARFAGIDHPDRFVKSLCKKAREQDGLERDGDYEPFENWRARREAEIGAAR